jgi:hypothetical protein
LDEAGKSKYQKVSCNADTEAGREYTTRYCAVKTILIPYLVKFDGVFTKKSPSKGHENRLKKNDVLKPRSACGYHEK